MDGEPLRVWLADGVCRRQRWHHSPTNPHRQRWVTIGSIEGGRRWFVELVGDWPRVGAWAFDGEERAREVVAWLLTLVAPWDEIPFYDARNRPLNGPWVWVGGRWRRPKAD